MKTNKRSLTFDQWMTHVDNLLEAKYSVTSSDLPDAAYRDMYDDGYEASRAANKAYKQAMEF